jgi:hypothetical protein
MGGVMSRSAQPARRGWIGLPDVATAGRHFDRVECVAVVAGLFEVGILVERPGAHEQHDGSRGKQEQQHQGKQYPLQDSHGVGGASLLVTQRKPTCEAPVSAAVPRRPLGR